MSAASPPAAQPAPPTIEEVLEVLLLCFEAAADALPSDKILAYAQEQRNYVSGHVVYVVWSLGDLEDPLENAADHPFLPTTLPRGLIQRDMCENFIWMLEGEVDRMVQHFGATARWALVEPKPASLFEHRSDTEPVSVPLHAVLIIELEDGECLVMDGTPEQLGWDRSTWLLPAKNFFADHALTHNRRWATTQDRTILETDIPTCDESYWVEAQMRMGKLFGELDWNALFGLPRAQRVEKVKKQADAKFADA